MSDANDPVVLLSSVGVVCHMIRQKLALSQPPLDVLANQFWAAFY
jgi:hypothetical protein